MIYTTFKIYATVRSRSLIDHLFNVGLAVPYKRLLEITKQLHEDMMASFQTHKAFIANQLREGVYTVLIKDNIDLDGTSTFVTTHYHGTSISILQFPSFQNPGTLRQQLPISQRGREGSLKLELHQKNIPVLQSCLLIGQQNITGHLYAIQTLKTSGASQSMKQDWEKKFLGSTNSFLLV